MNCQLRYIITDLENMKNGQIPGKLKKIVKSSSNKARKQ